MPAGEEQEFIVEMNKFLRGYKTEIGQYFAARGKAGQDDTAGTANKFKNFYKPKSYVLFSPFDLAVVALMDDFHFGVQAFSPFDPKWPTRPGVTNCLGVPTRLESDHPGKRTFYHKTLLGPCPTWRTSGQPEVVGFAERMLAGNVPPSSGSAKSSSITVFLPGAARTSCVV